MIRTAILAGLLVVMLAMAYGRSVLPGMSAAQPTPATQAAAAPVVPVVAPAAASAHVASAPVPQPAKPAHWNSGVVRENLLPPEDHKPAVAKVVEPAPAAPKVDAAAEPAAKSIADTSDVWPAPPKGSVLTPSPVQEATAPPPAPVSKAEEKPLPVAPMAMTPADDLPVREVATPSVHIPRDLPLPSETAHSSVAAEAPVAAAHEDDDIAPMPAPAPAHKAVAANAASAPQLMSPEERTRELYKLARDMEDTFISKLAH